MNENAQITGIYTITECDCSTPEAMTSWREILEESGKKSFRKKLERHHERFAIRKETVKNLVTTAGFGALLDPLVNDTPSIDPWIKYGAIGTGTTAVSEANTTLATEVFRATLASQYKSGNVAYNTFLAGNGDANGNTITEFGLFCGSATGTANSGTLFSRVLISPSFAKTSAKTLTIEVSHTFSNS